MDLSFLVYLVVACILIGKFVVGSCGGTCG
jgi:hypothetical protein